MSVLAVLSILGLIASCSEQPTQLVQLTDYFPLSKGNWWIYNYYETDIYSTKIPGTEKLDSIYVEEETDLNGRHGFILIDYRDGQVADTLFISKDSISLYMLFDDSFIDIPGFGHQWFRIADFTKNNNIEWHVYDSLDNNYQFLFEDTTVSSNYHNTINAQFDGTGKYTTETGTIDTKEFFLKYDTRLYFNFRFPENPGPEPVEVDRLRLKYLHFSFCNNIGLVEYISDPYTVRISTNPNVGHSKTESHKGWVRELIRYKLINTGIN